MKKLLNRSRSQYPLLKFDLKMKLSTLFMLVAFFTMQANTSYSQRTKVSLNLDNVSVGRLVDEIESRTEFRFVYKIKDVDLQRKVSVKAKRELVTSILDRIFSNNRTTYNVIDRQVFLLKNEFQGLSKDKVGAVQALQYTISGKVLDANGPLPGASIVEKGTSNGAQSDFDGNFSLTVTDQNAVLVISYIGFATKEVTVKDQTNITIILEESASQLNETIVIGYGSVKKTDLTGSVASLKGDVLNDLPIASLEQGIQGHVSGVQVTQSSGQPGGGISVRIRGVSSLAGGVEPLYVIDGLPLFNSDVRSLNGLSTLNPNDIQSIEILKDAAATSIYGSRGANGVVLVTTKTGKTGKIKVSYDSYLAVQKVRKKLPLMNGDEYIAFATEYTNNATRLTPEVKDQYLAQLSSFGNANTDWQDEIFRTALSQTHNLSVSGGSETNQYFVSTNYTDQEGIVKNTNFKRYSMRLNLNTVVNDWLNVSTRAVVSKVVQNGFVAGEGTNTRNEGKAGIGSTLTASPTVPVFNANGDFSLVGPYDFSGTDIENPVALLNALDKNTYYNFQGGFEIKAKVFKGLTNTTRIGLDYINAQHDLYFPTELIQLGSQTAELETFKKFSVVFEDFITYKAGLTDKLNMEIVAGLSTQSEDLSSIALKGTGFPSDLLQNNAIQAATTASIPETNVVKTTLASFFGRAFFDYSGKYLLSFSIRRDGASVFSKNNKWANFPSAAFAWRISEEEFIEDSSVISNLKFRASWGKSGNQAIRPYQSLVIGNIVNTPQGAGAGVNVGLAPNLPNANLTWETTEQIDFGVDLGLLNEKLRFTFDYYVKNTTDLLASVQLPQSSGFDLIIDNVGEVQNKGFEISLGSNLISTPDLQLSLDLNLSKNKNVVIATKDNQDIISGGRNDASRTTSIVRVGEPLFSFFVPKYLGLDGDGKPMYEDLDDNGVINDVDNQIAGNSFPDFFYGINSTIKYKQFSLLMSWQGVEGADINNLVLARGVSPGPGSNKFKNVKDYYPVINDDLDVKRSDRFIEDASFFRLKNIKLAYNVPVLSKIIDNLTLYLSAQNILTFTGYSGYDPEVNSFSGSNQLQGVDYSGYPSAKTVTVGFNVGF